MSNTDHGVVLDPVTHTYSLDGRRIPGVTEVIAANGFYEFPFVSPEDLQAKMLLGHHVHRACELYDRDELDYKTVSDEVAGYLRAYEAFAVEHSRWKVIESEFLVHHKLLDYAGTLDRVFAVLESTGTFSTHVLVDIKIGEEMPAARLQTAAYLAAYNFPNRILDRTLTRVSLHLKSNGNYRMVPHDGTEDFRAFCACLNLYHWKRNGHK